MAYTQLIPLPVPLGGMIGGLSLDDERRRPVDTLDAERCRFTAGATSFDAMIVSGLTILVLV